MSDHCLKKSKEAVRADRLNEAVDLLKKQLRRDPYWADGHRLLGDIYLIKLKHYVYALVQYRKLEKTKDQLEPLDRLRLAYGYYRRGFEEKVLETLAALDISQLPDEFKILDKKFVTLELIDKIKRSSDQEIEAHQDKYYKKNLRKAREYMQVGNFFRAQKAFEKALELKEDGRIRIELARCQVQRVNFTAAIKNLKKAQQEERCFAAAHSLLKDVYRRLGLPVVYDNQVDDKKRDKNRKTG
ncbi:MAG: tetratricopeptide repeat protein [bacterium]